MRSRSDQQSHLDLTEGGEKKRKQKKKQKLELMKDIIAPQISGREPAFFPQSAPHPARLGSSVQFQLQFGGF